MSMRTQLVGLIIAMTAAFSGRGCCLADLERVAVVQMSEGAAESTNVCACEAVRTAINASIRFDVERAVVWPPPSDNNRIMPATSVRIVNAPCDLAFEVLWPGISDEAFGVIWARAGEDSKFQPVRMLVDSASVATWSSLWPPMHTRSVDVLLRPSRPISYSSSDTDLPGPHNRLDLMHAGMSAAWSEGVVWIEDVPIEWSLKSEH